MKVKNQSRTEERLTTRFDPQRLIDGTRLESYSQPYDVGTVAGFARQLTRVERFQALKNKLKKAQK